MSMDTMSVDTMSMDTMSVDIMSMDTMSVDTMSMDTMSVDTMSMDTKVYKENLMLQSVYCKYTCSPCPRSDSLRGHRVPAVNHCGDISIRFFWFKKIPLALVYKILIKCKWLKESLWWTFLVKIKESNFDGKIFGVPAVIHCADMKKMQITQNILQKI